MLSDAAVEVVQVEQLWIDEARRAGRWHHDARTDCLGVAEGALRIWFSRWTTRCSPSRPRAVRRRPATTWRRSTAGNERRSVRRRDVFRMIRPAIVLIEHAAGGVLHEEGRVTDGPSEERSR